MSNQHLKLARRLQSILSQGEVGVGGKSSAVRMVFHQLALCQHCQLISRAVTGLVGIKILVGL